MYFIIPFVFLLLTLILTKNNIYAVIIAIITASIIYIKLECIYYLNFLTVQIPSLLIDILSPAGYLYPLLFLLGVAIIIDLFKNLHILESYTILLNKFFFNNNNYLIHIGIFISPLIFFIDDYLIMFGIKNFFSPLLKDNLETKKELIFYTSGLAPSGSVLLFFSTWSGIIIAEVQSMLKNINHFKKYTAVEVFLSSKKYFFFPIVIFISILLYIIYNKKNKLVLKECKNTKAKVIFLDIILFLLFPLCILSNFIYKLYFLKLSLYNIDVGLTMCEGLLVSTIIIVILLFFYKSVSLKYILNSGKNTLIDYKKTVLSLILCWLFSKIMVLLLQKNFIFFLPTCYQFLYPILYYISSLLVALLLGSEWGSIAIMIPLLSCINNYNILLISLGGIISGVIAGAQLSPISNSNITVSSIFNCESLIAYTYKLKWIASLILISGILFIITPFSLIS